MRKGEQKIVDCYLELHNDVRRMGLRFRYSAGCSVKAVLLFLPGRWHNSTSWRPSYADLDVCHYLSIRGYGVASLNYRSHYVNPSCDPQHSLVASGIDDYLNDILDALVSTKQYFGVRRVYLMGFSIGAALAFLSAGRTEKASEGFLGVIALDGGIAPRSPPCAKEEGGSPVDYRHPFSNSTETLPLIQNPLSLLKIRRLIQRALSLPKAEEQLNNILPGVGKFDSDGLRQLLSQDEWWPNRMVQEMEDITIGDASSTLSLTNVLSAIDVPILGICGVEKYGDHHRTAECSSRTTSKDVELKYLVGWKHLEVLCGKRAVPHVHSTILSWLESRWGH